MSFRNRLCQTGRVSSLPDVQLGTANRQTSFLGRGGACSAHKLPFSGHTKTFRGPSILQLNIEGLTASKMSVLNHFATELESLHYKVTFFCLKNMTLLFSCLVTFLECLSLVKGICRLIITGEDMSLHATKNVTIQQQNEK